MFTSLVGMHYFGQRDKINSEMNKFRFSFSCKRGSWNGGWFVFHFEEQICFEFYHWGQLVFDLSNRRKNLTFHDFDRNQKFDGRCQKMNHRAKWKCIDVVWFQRKWFRQTKKKFQNRSFNRSANTWILKKKAKIKDVNRSSISLLITITLYEWNKMHILNNFGWHFM